MKTILILIAAALCMLFTQTVNAQNLLEQEAIIVIDGLGCEAVGNPTTQWEGPGMAHYYLLDCGGVYRWLRQYHELGHYAVYSYQSPWAFSIIKQRPPVWLLANELEGLA